jgi:hypothetical protein
MQITLDFSQLTIPTPEPYDGGAKDKQRENLAYVVLQLIALAKQSGVKLTYTDVDTPPTTGLRLDGIELATKELIWNGQTIDLGPFKIILHNRAILINPVE